MRRHSLGQHYLTDGQVVRDIVECANVRPSERVLEIGTGRGALTRELAGLGSSLIAYEIDEENYRVTLGDLRGTKARVVHADAFGQDPEFDVLVASLPYSESATFVRWLSARRFDRAIVVLQKDFVEKAMAAPGNRDYRGISAVFQVAFEAKVLRKVGRASFDPPPRVESALVSLTPRRRLSEEEARRVIRLFSLRRRQVDSALAELGFTSKRRYGRRRIVSLTPDEVYEICGQ
jgi:16S rRNA (adenine1518-N6/adenine1519-N6)-dimethyltransferase